MERRFDNATESVRRMQMKIQTKTTIAAFVAVFLGRQLPADAWVPSATCGGGPFQGGSFVRWGGPFSMFRDRCSMPDGSNAASSFLNAGLQWRRIHNLMDTSQTYNDGCVITQGNGRSETALVARSQISNFNGLTTCAFSSCIFSPATFTECDTKLANDMVYSNEDESFFNWTNLGQGAVTNVHEFGHALGLGHSASFAVMRQFTPAPLVGGDLDHAEPFPDDADGVLTLYKQNVFRVNVFTSAQKFSSGVVATDAQTTLNRCRGQTFNVTYTVGNNGTVDITTDFRLFLNNAPGAFTGGFNLFSGTATSTRNGFFTETRTVTVPSNLPNGLWFILWRVDETTGNVEFNENDNFVHSRMTLNVQC
jgi:hypothetical protein